MCVCVCLIFNSSISNGYSQRPEKWPRVPIAKNLKKKLKTKNKSFYLMLLHFARPVEDVSLFLCLPFWNCLNCFLSWNRKNWEKLLNFNWESGEVFSFREQTPDGLRFLLGCWWDFSSLPAELQLPYRVMDGRRWPASPTPSAVGGAKVLYGHRFLHFFFRLLLKLLPIRWWWPTTLSQSLFLFGFLVVESF